MTPSATRSRRAQSRIIAPVMAFDPNVLRPATRQETLPVALGAVLLAFLSLIICYTHGYLLLYGDAVAHLGIARRLLDSRHPGLSQLGGVWLPLPHLLLMPFVQKLAWWQNGLAGAWPSLLCYVAGVAGFYRLARLLLVPRWAIAAAAFFALNPNLLYLATTAMTEPLFLALLLWLTLLTVECVAAMRQQSNGVASSCLAWLSILNVAAVYTRYEGWIVAAAVWCVIALEWARHRAVLRKLRVSFAVFTVVTVAAPLGWLAYNQHFMGDALDFLRGPYSAAAIERKTTPAGAAHYQGWHDPAWAMVLYTRTAQLDASAWETGLVVLGAAACGFVLVCRRRVKMPALLLWAPLPFYIYSIAFGSVPIFIPPFFPHSFYNSRYGMELLPALALFLFITIAWLEERVRTPRPVLARLMEPAALLLAVGNAAAMIHAGPLVLREAVANSATRVPFEAALARQLAKLPPGVPILMYNSDHVGALQQAGIPLRQTVSEGDRDSFQRGLAAPARNAAYVVAIAGDAVSEAIARHPEDLTELTVLCSTGQPCARLYRSDVYGRNGR